MQSVALFLHRVIEGSGMFRADLFSVASSARDGSSVRLLSPASWFKVAGILTASGKGFHIGISGPF